MIMGYHWNQAPFFKLQSGEKVVQPRKINIRNLKMFQFKKRNHLPSLHFVGSSLNFSGYILYEVMMITCP